LGRARSRRWAATVAIAVALLAALAGVGWIQIQQNAVMQQTVTLRDDMLQISLQSLQAEFLRLRATTESQLASHRIDRALLQKRYDLFVSRADTLTTQRAARSFETLSDYAPTVTAMQRFIARADRWLGPEVQAELTSDTLSQLAAQMKALDPLLHGLTLSATHQSASALAQRQQQALDYGRYGVGLIALLSLASVGFAALALTQLVGLRRRRDELERLTAELAAERDRADAANEAKSVFLANMSHEIRTPFQGLLGMLEAVDTARLTPLDRQRLAKAQESAQHLLAILNGILDWAQLEAGAVKVQPDTVAVRPLIDDAAALMRHAAPAHLQLHSRVDEAVATHLRLDATRVRQVLFNLLSNALKFTERGEVGLHVTRDDAQLVVAVSDSGVGMDEATLGRLFQRFATHNTMPSSGSNGKRESGPGPEGAGLGLQISWELARLMGGDLRASSQVGHGSRFELRLPYEPADPPDEEEPHSDWSRALEVPGAHGRTLQVLATEDDPLHREVLTAMIDQLGHRVTFARDSDEVLDCLARQAFDVALLNLRTPKLDGLQITERIRAQGGALALLPIVALTADAFAATHERCQAAGMNDVLAKPFDRQQLKQVLNRHTMGAVA
jgi:two-component system, sensor histidine kinase